MKGFFPYITVVAVMMLTAAGPLRAQNDLQVGKRTLNLKKSKFNLAGIAPRGETRTVVPEGDGVKATTIGTAANGSHIEYSYTTKYDGKDSKISGTGFPLGADTVAETRIDAYTTTSIAKKADKVVLETRSVVSKDGKTTTITTKGITPTGQKMSSTLVWDRQ